MATVTVLIGFLLSKPKGYSFRPSHLLILLAFAVVGFFVGIWSYTPVNLHMPFVVWILLGLIAGWAVVAFMLNIRPEYSSNWRFFVVPAIVGFTVIAMMVSSSTMFRADAVSSQIQPEDVEEDFLEEVDTNKVRLVSQQSALRVARNEISNYQHDGFVLGSVLNIDEDRTTIQRVDGNMYWVIPLEYEGMFSQFKLGDVPAYITVSAYDPDVSANIVTHTDTGDHVSIEYSTNAYFGRNAKRKLWQDDLTAILDEFRFQVDDDWVPHVVASVMEEQVGLSTYKSVGVKTLNLQTGEVNTYSKENAPDWIERVIPWENALHLVELHGKYHNGFLNRSFGKQGVYQPTETRGFSNMYLVEVGDETYWFSGVTSVSRDDASLLGSVLVNTRDYEEAYKIDTSGPDEQGVSDSIESMLGAESDVWEPTQPIPYRLLNHNTWVVPIIHSETGYFQGVGLMSMSNANIRAEGRDLAEALAKFNEALVSGNVVETEGVIERFEGTISFIDRLSVDGSVVAYFQLDEVEDRAFKALASDNPEFLVAQEGRAITFEAMDTGEKVLSVENLLNPWLDSTPSRELIIQEQEEDGKKQEAARDFDDLSLEERQQLMEEQTNE